ncbi:MAG: MFS transporter [Bacteroidota bacterium]
MQRISQTTIFLATAGCFLAFFVFGLTDNLKGPTLPAVMAELNIGYGAGGNILFGIYLGFVLATLFAGFLGDRFGLKSVLLLAGAFLLAGVSGYSSFGSAWLLAASLFAVGLGLGGLELGTNATIVALHHARKGLFLNLMSVMHGLGSMLAPLIAAWAFARDISWRSVYRWDLLLIAAFVVYFLALRFPRPETGEAAGGLEFHEIRDFAFRGSLPWFYLCIALYVAVEIGMASWLVTFLQNARRLSIPASNQALSLFFAMIMAGRFLGGFLVHRVGYLRSILLAASGAIVCISLGLFGGERVSIMLPLTGFFLSIIFPTLTAAVSDLHSAHTNTILGLLFTCAGLGGLAGPWLVAWGSDLFGLNAGFAINLLLAVLMLFTVLILIRGRVHEPAAA